MVFYRYCADSVLIGHAAFIAFIIFGLVLTLAGWYWKWRWVRNPIFRFAHLAAMGYVIAESYLKMDCPLTVWENHLRVRAGQDPYSNAGCIADWLHRLIFFDAPPWLFTVCYTAFGILVVAMILLAPPRLRRA